MTKNLAIEKLLKQYYKSFYLDQLGLKDWDQRIDARFGQLGVDRLFYQNSIRPEEPQNIEKKRF